ncbi:hypothetical protein KIW84_041481 [Lathyrus oleraceus]|uniref:Oligosaccharyl transferase STT3 N-terminal domain-containing protein n=1 Tax=Pisum sativum TaxID=3888 RepID=A0A9D4XBK6_PEA|nr:hypothetical protein KIW84_041481 [Pisum sativum]
MHLAFSNLEGALPKSSSGLKVESLWLNGQKRDGKLTGSVEVLQNMTSLTEVWLYSNVVNGPLPGFEGLKDLEGPVPDFGAGIVVAALIAISPGYISRSVVGSYDNEGVAIFALLLTFLFVCESGEYWTIVVVFGICIWLFLYGFGLGWLCVYYQFGSALCVGVVNWEILFETLCCL